MSKKKKLRLRIIPPPDAALLATIRQRLDAHFRGETTTVSMKDALRYVHERLARLRESRPARSSGT